MFSWFDIQIRKSFSGRLNWFLTSKIYIEKWKCPIFDSPQSKANAKGLLRNCTTEKFHNRHHTKCLYSCQCVRYTSYIDIITPISSLLKLRVVWKFSIPCFCSSLKTSGPIFKQEFGSWIIMGIRHQDFPRRWFATCQTCYYYKDLLTRICQS